MDEIADFERATYRVCANYRGKVDISARNSGAFLEDFRDDCTTVTFFYGFNGSVYQQEASYEWTTVESTGSVTETHMIIFHCSDSLQMLRQEFGKLA